MILAIPEEAHHVRETDVAVLECHQRLIVHFGHEKSASIVPPHPRRNAYPIALVVVSDLAVGHPREADLDAALSRLVIDISDQRNHNSIDLAHSFSIRAVKSVV